MDVFNTQNETIGKVEGVFLGTATPEQRKYGTGPATADPIDTIDDTFVEMIADVFAPDEIPDEVAERLRYSGFVRVNAVGFGGSDRFVTPDQIDHVSDEGVHLRLPEAPRIED
jgi:hypothetical protein